MQELDEKKKRVWYGIEWYGNGMEWNVFSPIRLAISRTGPLLVFRATLLQRKKKAQSKAKTPSTKQAIKPRKEMWRKKWKNYDDDGEGRGWNGYKKSSGVTASLSGQCDAMRSDNFTRPPHPYFALVVKPHDGLMFWRLASWVVSVHPLAARVVFATMLEIRVHACLLGWDPPRRIIFQERIQEVQAVLF